jgi:hypothetical protein
MSSFKRSNMERYDVGGSGSRVDEVDNWVVRKRPESSDHTYGSFGPMNVERWGGINGMSL